MIKRSFVIYPEMEKFVSDAKNRNLDSMRVLLFDEKAEAVKEIIANISLAYLLKEEKEVVPEDDELIARVRDEENVADAIGRYASLVCMYNDNFKPADFDEIYGLAYVHYFDHLRGMLDDYAFDGPRWKDCWKGAIFME